MVQKDLPGCGDTRVGEEVPTEGKKARAGRHTKTAGPTVKVVISAFHDAYVKAYDARPTWGAKPTAMLKRLVAQHGVDECLKRLRVLFERGLDWPKPPYTVNIFVANFDRLVGNVAPATRGVRPSDVLGGKR